MQQPLRMPAVAAPIGRGRLRRNRLAERGLKLELDETAKEFLVEHGTDEKFGARPLRRAGPLRS